MGKIILNGTDYAGGGGSGGHTIVDPTGTDMPQENKLQFTGAVSVSDDAVNGQTVVDVEGGGNYYLNTIYSTEEKRVGYWTDGKPLYQRTITYETPFNITNGSWYESSAIYPDMNIVNSDIVNSVFAHYTGAIVTIENSKLVIGNQTKNQPMNNIKYVTIQYTKTTDTAGSGNWNTDGVPTHHYSTNEQVIGTWIDGKPLYEKTFNFTGTYSGDQGSVPINMSIADTIFPVEAWGINSGNAICPFPYVHSSANNNGGFFISVDKNSIGLRFASGLTFKKVVITLRYTKTTD